MEEERRAGIAISASNIVSESIHASSINLLQFFGTIRTTHAVAMGQSHTNSNDSRAHNNLVTIRKSKKTIESKKGAYLEGTSTNFCSELRQSLEAASMEYSPKHKKNMEKWLRWKLETRKKNEHTNIETEAAKTGEGNVVALYFFDQYKSPQLWKTVEKSREEYPRVRSCRLYVVKYQLNIL